MSEMENIWDVINSRLNTIEKNNGKHEDKAIETIKNETLRKKKSLKKWTKHQWDVGQFSCLI